MQAELEAAQVSLKERDEELNSAKEAPIREGTKKSDHSSLAKDVKNSLSARVEATKRAEDPEAHALKAEECLKQVDAEVERHVSEYTETAEFDLIVGKESAAAIVNFVNKFQEEFPQILDLFNRFKVDWPEYFEGMPAPGETAEVFGKSPDREAAGGKIAEKEGSSLEDATVDDEATT
ncbi:hypothetical protein LIER_03463 [Lithospermum erythrorhizon]|uniref:Uncharacterized protein n=1 Tax=Lithospermum erythrorhizon TaxID=34254 RepID=A0AAV3NT74_LITER